MSEHKDLISPWPYRWAWLMAIATFPLLWIGQLITTTDAGMAVPDWPETYGQNMFAYPLITWYQGPWDVFVEHGHRLLASGIGLLTIGFVVVVWRCDHRPWLRKLAVASLVLVIAQGLLGGLRVEANARYVALIHGIVGPLFFAFTLALVVLTYPKESRNPSRFRWSLIGLPLLVLLQLTFGATLRHTPEWGSPWAFAMHVQCHLVTACLLVFAVGWSAFSTLGGPWARRLAQSLAALLVLQISLGIGSWYFKYRFPHWASDLGPSTIQASTSGGWHETNTVTAHSAVGSLLLALATARATLIARNPDQLPSQTHEEENEDTTA